MDCEWNELPLTVLQVIAKVLPVEDATSARLACSSWSQGIPLPRICIRAQPNMTCRQYHELQLPPQQRQLLGSLSQPGSCSRMARQCVISMIDSPAHPDEQQNWVEEPSVAEIGCVQGSVMQQIARALAQMPLLDSLTIRANACRTLATGYSQGCGSTAAATANLLRHLSEALGGKLHSLTLNLCSSWPSADQLNPIFEQLRGLQSLQLLQCPVAVLCSLPPLPNLKRLRVSGLVTEPVPRSYSYRQKGWLLPLLPKLQQLVLKNMPLDLRVQELDDIQQQQWRQAQQQQQHQQFKLANHDSSTTTVYGQWVGSSIAQQCPNLQRISSDVEVGPLVSQLKHLETLMTPRSAWHKNSSSSN